MNNINNLTISKANPPFKGKYKLAFANDNPKLQLATQILKGRFVGVLHKLKTKN